MELYFKDRIFYQGQTDILNESGETVGILDLDSRMTSSISVYCNNSTLQCSGKFRFLSGKWEVLGPEGEELGLLRARFSLFSKRFEYDAGTRGLFTIESPAFSQSYKIEDIGEREAATFQKVNGWLQAGAFRLQNHSNVLGSFELVAIIIGINNIEGHQSAATTS
ncbi:hypothetical protein ACFQZE_13980 [Paenibacillus sp. GCM10027627]|uniref:hypothetical protein n=1 Tax=unclassified Paenibacillus TaxID=185978 RepID=UPI003627222F